MSLIILPKYPRRIQPAQNVVLDRTNPIAASSTVIFNASAGLINLVNGARFTNPLALSAAKNGIGLTQSVASKINVTVSVAAHPYVMYVVQTRNGSANWVGLSSTSSNTSYSFVRGDPGTSTDAWTVSTGTENTISASPATANGQHCYVMIARSDTDRTLIIDGVVVGTSSTSRTASYDRFNLGGIERTASAWLNKQTNQLMLAGLSQGFYLTNAQGIELSLNPWQIFKPLERKIWIGVSGGGSPTDYALSGANGTYTVSGQAATLSHARNLVGANGTYVVSGQAATLLHARNLVGANGTYTVSGQAATLTYSGRVDYALSGANGTYSVSGQPATLLHARTLLGANGTYSLTGQDAALLHARNLVGANGTYTVSGQNASLAYAGSTPYALSGEPGSYSIVGGNAVLNYRTTAQQNSGGYDPYQKKRRRTKEDIELERIALGITEAVKTEESAELEAETEAEANWHVDTKALKAAIKSSNLFATSQQKSDKPQSADTFADKIFAEKLQRELDQKITADLLAQEEEEITFVLMSIVIALK